MIEETGVILDRGAQDWQIFQQDEDGSARIALSGHWRTPAKFKTAEVIVRVVFENDYLPVSRTLDWRGVETGGDGHWRASLRLPCGGLYRIETALRLNQGRIEESLCGDAVHHVGVGDVWGIAGQSNASGNGRSPVQDAPELGVHVFRHSGEWALAAHPLADSTRTRYPDCRDNGAHSPFLAFARQLKARQGYPIGLIPAALGASGISLWLPSMDGRLLRNMIRMADDAAGGKIKGLCWFQGCTDTLTPQFETYYENFREFVEATRAGLNMPGLPVISAQINRVNNHPSHADTPRKWDAIREAQRQAARGLDGVYLISTIDCALDDCIHHSSHANLVIGGRMAAMALGKVYGHDMACLYPDLREARRVDAQTVELVFDNVVERLLFDVQTPERFPFSVRDASGEVPMTGIALPTANTIQLKLGRGMQGVCHVIGAPGNNPPMVVPFDVSGYRPMLAFTAPVV
jgi:sialate O-acetylesterase